MELVVLQSKDEVIDHEACAGWAQDEEANHLLAQALLCLFSQKSIVHFKIGSHAAYQRGAMQQHAVPCRALKQASVGGGRAGGGVNEMHVYQCINVESASADSRVMGVYTWKSLRETFIITRSGVC